MPPGCWKEWLLIGLHSNPCSVFILLSLVYSDFFGGKKLSGWMSDGAIEGGSYGDKLKRLDWTAVRGFSNQCQWISMGRKGWTEVMLTVWCLLVELVSQFLLTINPGVHRFLVVAGGGGNVCARFRTTHTKNHDSRIRMSCHPCRHRSIPLGSPGLWRLVLR